MVDAVNPAQEDILRLLARTSYNALDGWRVASDLRANLPLWRAAYFGPENDADIGLVLRDLDRGVLNMSTLYLLPEPGRLEELEALAQPWGADDLDPVTVFGLDRQEVLRLWWD